MKDLVKAMKLYKLKTVEVNGKVCPGGTTYKKVPLPTLY